MDAKLKAAIKRAKHTQASIARELKVTPQAVHQWEMGKVPWYYVVPLSKILKVPKGELLEGML